VPVEKLILLISLELVGIGLWLWGTLKVIEHNKKGEKEV
jgi:hypothetical protein